MLPAKARSVVLAAVSLFVSLSGPSNAIGTRIVFSTWLGNQSNRLSSSVQPVKRTSASANELVFEGLGNRRCHLRKRFVPYPLQI
eukprot:scaffold426135_cov43-Prasinocladus_malaysianus.AAC.1